MNVGDDYRERLFAARAELDRLDREIIELLLSRMRVAAKIGQLRSDHGVSQVGARDRGDEVLARYRDSGIAQEGAGTVSLEGIGRAILEQSAALQRLIIQREAVRGDTSGPLGK
jgi:chorismate mutase